MAESLTTEVLERLQELQRLHKANQMQQAKALHQAQGNNGPSAATTAAAEGGRRRRRPRQPRQPRQTQEPQEPREPLEDPAQEEMVLEAGRLNHQNRRAYKTWYRDYKRTVFRAGMSDASRQMTRDLATYGITDPDSFVASSTSRELRDLLQHLPTNMERLALFDLALRRQTATGDLNDNKVILFNTIHGRRSDMPFSTV